LTLCILALNVKSALPFCTAAAAAVSGVQGATSLRREKKYIHINRETCVSCCQKSIKPKRKSDVVKDSKLDLKQAITHITTY